MVHIPVLLKEVLDYLKPRNGFFMLDCTVGAGGHSKEILQRIMPDGILIGIDKDEDILRIAGQNLKEFEGHFFLFKKDFVGIDSILDTLHSLPLTGKIKSFDGMLFDLGVSSFQIDSARRGFSFSVDGPLDMRMDKEQDLSAYTIVNRWTKDEIADVLFNYGGERFSRKVASGIIEKRKKHPIKTTFELSNIILSVIKKRGKIHPATRTFQALRIAVNEELSTLEKSLPKAIQVLARCGRICVISFHSLEDRIVKRTFKKYEKQGIINILTTKPIRPSLEETRVNPRARSSILRAAEKR
ncbi:16S rRNA (cytosine(1402)-N(4))-methyltransferase [bacterium Unc6]|nr:16S rRNA (cytosine(1402)-N(4))-methyltransferase [bacterium Unc6]